MSKNSTCHGPPRLAALYAAPAGVAGSALGSSPRARARASSSVRDAPLILSLLSLSRGAARGRDRRPGVFDVTLGRLFDILSRHTQARRRFTRVRTQKKTCFLLCLHLGAERVVEHLVRRLVLAVRVGADVDAVVGEVCVDLERAWLAREARSEVSTTTRKPPDASGSAGARRRRRAPSGRTGASMCAARPRQKRAHQTQRTPRMRRHVV